MANSKNLRLKRIWRRAKLMHILGRLLSIIVVLVLAVLLLLHRMFLGPSSDVCEMLTMSLTETSALKFVPYLYMSSDAVNNIIQNSRLIEPDTETDTSLITISAEEVGSTDDEQDIELIYITGSSYKAYLMIVKDPSRVFVGVGDETFSSGGRYLDYIISKYDAVAGINANGFMDDNGLGNGGVPKGLVISEGKLLSSSNTEYTCAGFDSNNILHVGKFTNAEAKELGLRDAVAWGPALVVNGEPVEQGSVSTGLNPRTAIGQRADGAVLLLVVDGRHASSLGATYADLIDIMLEYGAVNACNLDGGSSSCMYLNGERINSITPITGTRGIPCAVLVKEAAE